MSERDAYWLAGSPVAISTAGCLVIAADLLILQVLGRDPLLAYAVRGSAAVLIMFALLGTRRAAPSDFGLTVTGWRGDAAWMIRLGVIVLGIYVLLAGLLVMALRWKWFNLTYNDVDRFRSFRDMDSFQTYVLSALICAPVVEELIYRAFTVPALAAGFGRRAALWLSGPVFYLLHLAYGKPAGMLHYLVAGWILGWAFIRCGRLWVPIALHFLGNILVGFHDAVLLWAPDLARQILGR